jgi:CheY-like chemotaxis protein
VAQKTILLIDDEPEFLEALEDALTFEGYRVLKASTGEEALQVFSREHIDLATIDMMMPLGPSLMHLTTSQRTGLYLCKEIVKKYPQIDLFCLSVVNDLELIKEIQSLGVRFLRKGETPLRTLISMINSLMTGIAYSTDNSKKRDR